MGATPLMWCLGFHPIFFKLRKDHLSITTRPNWSAIQATESMLQGQVLPTPRTPPRTRREALELYAAFSFSRYVIVPWRVCSICIYVYTYMNIYLYSLNIYIHISWCLYHAITCVNMFPSGQDVFLVRFGVVKELPTSTIWFIPLLVVATMIQKQRGWVSKISPLDLNHSDLKFPNPGKSIEDVNVSFREIWEYTHVHTSILYLL